MIKIATHVQLMTCFTLEIGVGMQYFLAYSMNHRKEIINLTICDNIKENSSELTVSPTQRKQLFEPFCFHLKPGIMRQNPIRV